MKRRKLVAAYSYEEFNLSADNATPLEAPEVVSKDTPAVEEVFAEDAADFIPEDIFAAVKEEEIA